MKNALVAAAVAALLPSAVEPAPGQGADSRPGLTLGVSPLKLTAPASGGSASFTVDVRAARGFSGTLRGSITVSQPTNGERIALLDGSQSRTFSFALSEGQKMSDFEPTERRTFRVEVAAGNRNAGNLAYSVFLNPSRWYAVRGSPKLVVVTVTR